MFDQYFLMKPSDVQRYAVDVLHYFAPDEETECTEIGDGNINYVFRVRAKNGGRSLVVKQADTLLRTSGRPLDQNRSRLEAEALRLEAQLVPGSVPEVYNYDETMCALAMEDLSAYHNLREELMAGRVRNHLADTLSTFLVDSLFPTTDLVMDRQEKRRLVQRFSNPELCDITEDLVLTEPFWNYKNRNVITPGNEKFVENLIYRETDVHPQVAYLRNRFLNSTQALLHGDLHAGSIFVDAMGIKVIDPEFATYGPMGYDIGNVLASFLFPWAYLYFTAPTNYDAMDALRATIRSFYRQMVDKLDAVYEEKVTFPLYQTDDFRRAYLSGIMADAWGYAGTELIRRVVGDAKVPEVTTVEDLSLRISIERGLLRLGGYLIEEHDRGLTGDAVAAAFRTFMA